MFVDKQYFSDNYSNENRKNKDDQKRSGSKIESDKSFEK